MIWSNRQIGFEKRHMNSNQPTADKILDVAEALFAEHGIASTSLRKIVSSASVNIAAIHYHFGSKEELVRAVFRRRIEEVNSQRLQQLEVLRSEGDDRPIAIEKLLRAFIEPVFSLSRDEGRGGLSFIRLVARAHAETDQVVQDEVGKCLKTMIEEFSIEFARTLPYLSEHERRLRLAFSAGAMVQMILMPLKEKMIREFFPFPQNQDQSLEMLIGFCVAGMSREAVLDG